MKRHLLIASDMVQVSTRWLEAFADGRVLNGAQALALAAAGDTLWLPVENRDWMRRLGDICAAHPACSVVVISNEPDTQEALRALEAGARGYCHAYAAPGLLREVAQVVDMGGLWVGPELLSRFVGVLRQRLPIPEGPPPQILSAREAEVARAIADGLSNKEAAALLGITERTVKAHLGAAFEKLGVRDRLQLVLKLSGRAPVASGE